MNKNSTIMTVVLFEHEGMGILNLIKYNKKKLHSKEYLVIELSEPHYFDPIKGFKDSLVDFQFRDQVLTLSMNELDQIKECKEFGKLNSVLKNAYNAEDSLRKAFTKAFSDVIKELDL